MIVVEPVGGAPVVTFEIGSSNTTRPRVEQHPEVPVVVHVCERLSIALARHVRSLSRHHWIRGRPARPRIDADRRQRRRLAVQLAGEGWIFTKQAPAVGDRKNGFAFLADAAQISGQIRQRIECQLLAPPLDHLVCDPAVVIGALPTRSEAGKAHAIVVFHRVR
ncbi:MAG: hypothetical protein DMG03_25475 [Acidobacteria bacterium]|nr:MAG: hypothetical protein DMG03_25475 [Acidobacteriota bacterium]